MLMAAFLSAPPTPPVPGLCTAPAAQNVEKPGCYLSAEIPLVDALPVPFWHVYEFAGTRQADAEQVAHRLATVVVAHRRTWLYVLGGPDESVGGGGTRRAVIGPLRVPAGEVHARLMESIFTPGMRTRVHSHGGPEAFDVVDGEQCMESPTDWRKLGAGSTCAVAGGPHVQSAPRGRRNLVLILAPTDQPWSTPRNDWTPSGFCDG
ncbi:MAG: hypothetical protein INR65_12170 [Gluconacetobacter diazotrophicus]|nr:hypothetical protein [Gluconacetobacter diazotrophicus]